jgi:hypothetical protein
MTDTTAFIADDLHYLAMFNAGREWAASLKAGDTFRGSYGEADHRGLTEWDAKFFSGGAHVELTNRSIMLVNDDSNIIHSIV